MSLSRLKFQVSHARFCVLFPAALFAVCNAINIDRLAKWFRTGDGLDVLALSAYLLAGLCLFIVVFALLAHRWTTKPLAILLIVTAGAATYFISKYGVAIDSSMIRNAVHTDSTEVGQLLSSQMIPYALFLIVLPVLTIWRTDIQFAPAGRHLWSSLKLIGIAFAIALLSLFAQYNAIFRAGNVSNSTSTSKSSGTSNNHGIGGLLGGIFSGIAGG